ncbi:unnamed protein product [Rodentolepis nana]|uniref:Secreted protein n=1 Tax=Rodentolepis nana TaxID=102285 RepID=A0A0R3T1L6_RODNA|nr:unnamed protein product [Rodentolepis nana]
MTLVLSLDAAAADDDAGGMDAGAEDASRSYFSSTAVFAHRICAKTTLMDPEWHSFTVPPPKGTKCKSTVKEQ